MNITGIGTIKKNRNEVAEWYNIMIRQSGYIYYINAYFQRGTFIPENNHKVHFKARGKLFKDKKTKITRLSFYDTEVIEDLGLDDVEVLAQGDANLSALKLDKFSVVDIDEDDDALPWED